MSKVEHKIKKEIEEKKALYEKDKEFAEEEEEDEEGDAGQGVIQEEIADLGEKVS